MLAIIGTAGRGSDGQNLTPAVWNRAKRLVLDFIQKYKTTELISGGAAWADHMAVELFNKKLVERLVLALPCPFDVIQKEFIEQGAKSCGATANYYHHLQSRKLNKNTLEELAKAIKSDAEIIVGNGFLNRNLIVANRADGVLAITFGDKQKLKDGGTAHTMSNFIKKKTNKYAFHLDLNSMEIYPNAVVPDLA